MAVNDTATTLEDTAATIAVLDNDTDLDGDTLVVSSVTVPAHGTAAVNPDGTIAYAPAANYNGADSFSYTVGDGNGGSATATVTVTVTAANDGPVAVNDAATTAEDTAATIAVLTNDSDLDGDALVVSSVTVPAHGTAAVNPDGTIAYAPAANFNGADSFSYTIGDGNGGTATATVNVTVTAANDGPVAVNDTATTVEDTAATIAVLATTPTSTATPWWSARSPCRRTARPRSTRTGRSPTRRRRTSTARTASATRSATATAAARRRRSP